MEALSQLTNQELNHKIQFLVGEERRATVEVLRLLREIERRLVYAELGYSSLFAYCTAKLGYSEAAASRRIEAMRAMRDVVEIENQIESGKLSLSTVAQARVVIRAHERETKIKVSTEQKKSVMLQLSGLSKRAAEKILVHEFPLTLSARPVLERQLSTGVTRLTLDLTDDEMAVIEDLRRLKSKNQTAKDLFLNLARKELAKKKRERGEAPPLRKPRKKDQAMTHSIGGAAKSSAKKVLTSSDDNCATPPAEEPRENSGIRPARPTRSLEKEAQPFSVPVKRDAWQKAKSQCEYVSPAGRRCEERNRLEFDHRTPVALGGKSDVENIRVLCREHNVFQAVQKLGAPVMARYLPRLGN